MPIRGDEPHRVSETRELAISQLRLDGGTQVREQLDKSAVREYATLLADGSEPPPIDVVFDGANYWVANGFHRIAACKRVGLGMIRANITEGTQEDAKVLAAGSNANHGVRRTSDDIQRAFDLLMEVGWRNHSQSQLRTHLRISISRLQAMLEDYDAKQAEQSIFDPVEDAPEVPDEEDSPDAEPDEAPEPTVTVRRGDTEYEMKVGRIGRQESAGKRAVKKADKLLGMLQDALQEANREAAGLDEVPCKKSVDAIQRWLDSVRGNV